MYIHTYRHMCMYPHVYMYMHVSVCVCVCGFKRKLLPSLVSWQTLKLSDPIGM